MQLLRLIRPIRPMFLFAALMAFVAPVRAQNNSALKPQQSYELSAPVALTPAAPSGFAGDGASEKATIGGEMRLPAGTVFKVEGAHGAGASACYFVSVPDRNVANPPMDNIRGWIAASALADQVLKTAGPAATPSPEVKYQLLYFKVRADNARDKIKAGAPDPDHWASVLGENDAAYHALLAKSGLDEVKAAEEIAKVKAVDYETWQLRSAAANESAPKFDPAGVKDGGRLAAKPLKGGAPASAAKDAVAAPAADGAEMVTITPSGKKYHRADCSLLSRSKNTTVISKADAEAKGLEPCSKCKP